MALFKSVKSCLVVIVLFTGAFTNNIEKDLAKSLSVSPHHTVETSNIFVSLSLYEYNSNPKLKLNSQIWFSPNLYAKGGISPGKYDSYICSAYQMGLGYVPQLPWSEKSTTVIEFGEYHLKWYGDKHYKWQYGTVTQSINYKKNQIHFSWMHFLDSDWNHEQFSIILSRNIDDSFSYQLQNDLYWTGSRIKLNPVITISAEL